MINNVNNLARDTRHSAVPSRVFGPARASGEEHARFCWPNMCIVTGQLTPRRLESSMNRGIDPSTSPSAGRNILSGLDAVDPGSPLAPERVRSEGRSTNRSERYIPFGRSKCLSTRCRLGALLIRFDELAGRLKKRVARPAPRDAASV